MLMQGLRMLTECLCSCFAENLIAWKSRRPRKRRAKNRRRKAKENTRKSRRVVTTRVTPPAAAAIVIVAQIQTVMASSRAKRERRTREKIPVGITAPRASHESRVRKAPPVIGAGHRALTLDRSSLKRSPEIIDRRGQRGERAGVEIAARRTRSSRREVKRERETTAGTGRDLAAPGLAWTEVGAARKAGRTEVKTGVTVEMVRGTEVAQMEGKAEQQMGGAEAGKDGETGRAGEEVGLGVGREEREAKTEQKEGIDCFFSPLIQQWTKHENVFCYSCCVVFLVITQSPSILNVYCAWVSIFLQ